jgi:Bacterial Ig-like domain (group 2)
MKNVRFAFVALVLVALLTACPAATPEAPKVSSITVSGPSTNALKLNEATAFTAIAKDSSGATITGKTFTWTSSDDKIATVDSSGKVTANHFGTVKITASVDSTTGSSATQTTYGLEVTGGVRDYGDPTFLVRFRNADGSNAKSNPDATITGPSGWNGGQPYSRTIFFGDSPFTWFEPGFLVPLSHQSQVPTWLTSRLAALRILRVQPLTPPANFHPSRD